jgi:hypothetical protein
MHLDVVVMTTMAVVSMTTVEEAVEAVAVEVSLRLGLGPSTKA